MNKPGLAKIMAAMYLAFMPSMVSAETLYSKAMQYVVNGKISQEFLIKRSILTNLLFMRFLYREDYKLPNGIVVRAGHDTDSREEHDERAIQFALSLMPYKYAFMKGSEGLKEIEEIEYYLDPRQDGLNGNEEQIFPPKQ